MAEPLTLPDGTPCWCVDPQTGSHEPRCQTQRAFAGVKGQPSWLRRADGSSVGTGPRAHTASLKDAFIAAYSRQGIIRTACEAAGIVRGTVDDWRKNDPDFAQRMLAAKEEATDLLEAEAIRRGAEGWEEPIYQGGEYVGEVRKYSDALLQLMLKGNRPKVFRENIRAELSGPDGGPITHAVIPAMEDHERQLLRKVLEEAIAAQSEAEVAASTAVSENASPILAGD